ncbi:cysteine--tRNA ligase [Thermoproteota archaeon]
MALKIYNTLSRKKEEFKPLKEGIVGLYTCGPTVYDYAHIGNLRAMMFYDLVKRYLKYNDYDVNHVMNITDVDDKTIKGAKKQGKSLKEFTEFYEKEFFDDLGKLNIEKPDTIPRATEHIKEMTELIARLKKKGHTYEKAGSVYFSINSFEGYGKLANLDIENLKQNADGRMHDADEYEKENARDFALWKAYDEEDGNVFWETEFGKGRPGWHIECSAMSIKYLGEAFDMHLGGVDLVFPHHTNEIAQTEGATGKKWVKYWMHNEHLLVDGKKMSKSLGNFYTLRDLLGKGNDPKAIRWLFMATHYRQQLNFTEESLKAAEQTVKRLEEFMIKLDEYNSESEFNPEVSAMLEKAKTSFEEAMDDDLETSRAFAVVFDLVRDVNKLMADKKMSITNAKEVVAQMKKFDSVLGVLKVEETKIDSEIEKLIQERERARKNKDWEKSDKIRDQLKNKGIHLLDTPDGVKWRKI